MALGFIRPRFLPGDFPIPGTGPADLLPIEPPRPSRPAAPYPLPPQPGPAGGALLPAWPPSWPTLPSLPDLRPGGLLPPDPWTPGANRPAGPAGMDPNEDSTVDFPSPVEIRLAFYVRQADGTRSWCNFPGNAGSGENWQTTTLGPLHSGVVSITTYAHIQTLTTLCGAGEARDENPGPKGYKIRYYDGTQYREADYSTLSPRTITRYSGLSGAAVSARDVRIETALIHSVDGSPYLPPPSWPPGLPAPSFPAPSPTPEPAPAPDPLPAAPPAMPPPTRPPMAPPVAPPDTPQTPGPQPPTVPALPGTPQPAPPGFPQPVPTPGPTPGPGQPSPAPGTPGDASSPGTGRPPEVGADGVQLPIPFPPPVTPPALEDFWGDPIGQPSARPRPTLEGIAAETGKLEQKLRIIGNPNRPAGGVPPNLADLLKTLWDTINAIYPAGAYELAGPCERDKEGNLLPPVVAAWDGGLGSFGELNAKVDALAELIQAHKTMGQPTCIKQRRGAPVTVILREVEGE